MAVSGNTTNTRQRARLHVVVVLLGYSGGGGHVLVELGWTTCGVGGGSGGSGGGGDGVRCSGSAGGGGAEKLGCSGLGGGEIIYLLLSFINALASTTVKTYNL